MYAFESRTNVNIFFKYLLEFSTFLLFFFLIIEIFEELTDIKFSAA